MFFDVARFRALKATCSSRRAYLEFVGCFIMSLPTWNPLRRWLEASWARTAASRVTWQAGRDAEWAAVRRSNAELIGLLNLDRGPTDALH